MARWMKGQEDILQVTRSDIDFAVGRAVKRFLAIQSNAEQNSSVLSYMVEDEMLARMDERKKKEQSDGKAEEGDVS